jgi:hypothetical protein
MEDFILTDEDRFLRHINHLLKRMTEIRDNIDNEWIIDHLQANKVLLDKTVDILGEIDPQGLVNCGAPDNEYMPEAETILLRQSEWKTIDDLEKVIAEEFAWWVFLYDENDKVRYYGAPVYKVTARQIWNAWLEIKGQPPEVFSDKIELPPKKPPIIIEIE